MSDYLLRQCRELLGMDDAKIEPTSGDCTYSGEQVHQITAYSGTGDKIQRLLSHSFDYASFSCDDEGKLGIIRLGGADLFQKWGTTPIITLKRQKSRWQGVTNVSHELPGAAYAKDVELFCLIGRREQYFMSCYRFLMELP